MLHELIAVYIYIVLDRIKYGLVFFHTKWLSLEAWVPASGAKIDLKLTPQLKNMMDYLNIIKSIFCDMQHKIVTC